LDADTIFGDLIIDKRKGYVLLLINAGVRNSVSECKNLGGCSITCNGIQARAFNFTYRYIDDVLSINNSRFAEFLPLIYPPELEVKETTYTICGIVA
jgi:hypothetical protein